MTKKYLAYSLAVSIGAGVVLGIGYAHAFTSDTSQGGAAYWLPTSMPVPPTPTPDPRVEALKKALQTSPNYLQYTEYKMLRYRNANFGKPAGYPIQTSYDYSDYSLKPTGSSPLNLERTGEIGINTLGELESGINILTGQRAVDESMQLGSIGFGQSIGNTRAQGDQRQVQLALELYFDAFGNYPDRLEQLVPTYISQLPQTRLTYRRTGTTYALTIGSGVGNELPISSVTPLTIRSHPWRSMLKDAKPDIPDMFSIVPKDFAVLYFRDTQKLTQLEDVIKTMSEPLQNVYRLKDASAIRDTIFRRLGIRDIKELRMFIDELAIISYDLDFYPNTDYALILKVKAPMLNSFISDFISAPANRHGRVGNYYVIATDEALLKNIENLASEHTRSLKASDDMAYVTSVLEKDYDGMAYFSEAFIQKLTGPAYRIGARRRNTTLVALEALQYATFAYRDITGAWPRTVRQMMDEGYLAPNSVANVDEYSITADGYVRHAIWNTLYDTTPVGRIAIRTVSAAEQQLYDSFREGYEQFWREFIDPVGVTIIVGDHVRFHTIILPLIEESSYNWLRDMSGKDPIAFSFVADPTRTHAMQLDAKLNIDDILYAAYREFGYSMNKEYQECVNAYYTLPMEQRTGSSRSYTEHMASCKKNLSREEGIAQVKKFVAEFIEWKEPEDVFSFVGNEVMLAAGEAQAFKISNIASFDFYAGLTITNTDVAKKFLDHLFVAFNKMLYGLREGSTDMFGLGLFMPDTPIANTYNNVEYYMVPTGFINAFYAFINDRFYFTLSQRTMNKIIDGAVATGEAKPRWNSHMTRLFDFLGPRHNVMAVADATKLQQWLKGFIRSDWTSYAGSGVYRARVSHLTEALVLAKTLPDYDGTAKNASRFYRFMPEAWFSAKLFTRDGDVFLGNGDKEYKAREVRDDTRYGYSYMYGAPSPSPSSNVPTLAEIVKTFDLDSALDQWTSLRDAGVGLTLKPEGLDIKIAFNNPLSDEVDARVTGIHDDSKLILSTRENINGVIDNVSVPVASGVGGGAVVLGGGVWWWLMKRRREAYQVVTAVASVVAGGASPIAAAVTTPVSATETISATATGVTAEITVASDITSYIAQCRALSMSTEEIRANLVQANWQPDAIDAAFAQETKGIKDNVPPSTA